MSCVPTGSKFIAYFMEATEPTISVKILSPRISENNIKTPVVTIKRQSEAERSDGRSVDAMLNEPAQQDILMGIE